MLANNNLVVYLLVVKFLFFYANNFSGADDADLFLFS